MGPPLVAVIASLAIWHVLAVRADSAMILPTPASVIAVLINLITSGELLSHATASVWRLLAAFVLAVLVGVPLGFLMGISRVAEDMIDPLVEVIRPISGIAWIPLGLFIFGISDALPIAIMFYVAVFPIVLNTVAGVKTAPVSLIRASRMLGLSGGETVLRVLVPATVPAILTGARLGAGGTWLALVAAEFIGAPTGLGFSIWWYAGLLRTSEMLAFIVVVGIAGFLTDASLRKLQRTLTPWVEGLKVSA